MNFLNRHASGVTYVWNKFMKKFDKQFAGEILKYALWFGIVAGLVEGILLYVLQRFEALKGQITYLGLAGRYYGSHRSLMRSSFCSLAQGWRLLRNFCRASLRNRQCISFFVLWFSSIGFWFIFPVD